MQDPTAVPTRNPVSKYTLKMNKDGKDYEEQVDIDTEKETDFPRAKDFTWWKSGSYRVRL